MNLKMWLWIYAKKTPSYNPLVFCHRVRLKIREAKIAKFNFQTKAVRNEKTTHQQKKEVKRIQRHQLVQKRE